MPGNANSGTGPKFKMSEEEFKNAISLYKGECKDGTVLRPSLSHFCGRLETTEDYLCEWLEWGKKPTDTYYTRAEALKVFMTWLRGEMFSSGKYDGPTAKKFVELQLGRDYGDGVTYNNNVRDSGPKSVKIMFGESDAWAIEASE